MGSQRVEHDGATNMECAGVSSFESHGDGAGGGRVVTAVTKKGMKEKLGKKYIPKNKQNTTYRALKGL